MQFLVRKRAARGLFRFARCGDGSPRAKSFPDRPCLRDASIRSERRIPVKNFAGSAKSGGLDVAKHRFQKRHRLAGIPINAQVSQREWTEKPTPHRALVIGGVALFGASCVASPVRWLRSARGCEGRRKLAVRARTHPRRRAAVPGSERLRAARPPESDWAAARHLCRRGSRGRRSHQNKISFRSSKIARSRLECGPRALRTARHPGPGLARIAPSPPRH